VAGRVFAVTAGYGFTAINRGKLEMGFGLKATLNEIDPHKIKNVDARKIDTTTRQKRVLLNHNSPLHDFEFDIDEDLLSLIAGEPRDEELAKKLSGADSLVFTGDLSFQDIGQKCEALLEAFQKEEYRAQFGFIDHLRVVKDPDLQQVLEALLIAALGERRHDRLLLAYPEIDTWSQIERFKLIYARHTTEVEEVDLASVYEFLDAEGFVGVDPHKFSIIGLDHNGNAVTKKHSLYEYAVMEVEREGQRYLLSLRRWFCLAADYVEEVEQAVAAIQEIDDPFYLPPMSKGQREDEYNEAAGESEYLICLDKTVFNGLPGYSKVEVCDLLSGQSEFICVKKYNASSTLSHLFAQGYVSATLLFDHPQYRQFVVQHCPEGWHLAFGEDHLEREGVTYVFAIASDAEGSLAESLPFFSKVNLRNATKDIQRIGFGVRIFKIPLQ
jgi:uncharacterized protein (TIGR04141 family)